MLVLGVEPGQERKADRGVEVLEESDCGRGGRCAGARGAGSPAATRCLTRSLRARQARRSATVVSAVGDQGPQPGPVGAQGVGQHVGVEPVVLVSGRAVAAAKVLDLVRADHDHGQAGRRAGSSTIGPSGRSMATSTDAVLGQHADELASPAAVCSTVHRWISRPRPSTIATAWSSMAQSTPAVTSLGGNSGSVGIQVVAGRLHVSLLAASTSGEAPSSRVAWCRDVPAGSLTDRRSQPSGVGAQPYRRSTRPGQPPSPADLMMDVVCVASRAVTWRTGVHHRSERGEQEVR